ncbi:uncharacterized protein LOC135493941 [Lineus longissimus]|uniref:uncharacterized protein LOC135493941 n=1 Tax=Lineus longissimus TaxID=88925 RepID=UPI002B4E6588
MAEQRLLCHSDELDIDMDPPPATPLGSQGQGSFAGEAGGDNVAPEFLSTASEWNEKHARELNITYHNRNWRSITAQFDFLKPNRSETEEWRTITDVFKGLMDSVPLNIQPASSSDVMKILRKKITPGISIECQKELSGKDKCTIWDLLNYVRLVREKISSRRVAKEMIRRTGAKKSLHLFIPNVCMFLDGLIIILNKFCSGVAPTEAAFQHLFVLFARIFMLSFSPGNISPAREMKIFGNKVTCQPDLRYEYDSKYPVVLVSVAEVKKYAPKKKAASARPEGLVARSATGSDIGSNPPPPKRMKMENEDDDDVDDDDDDDDRETDFPSSVKGRHAAELLLEVPFTIQRHFPDKKCVLGLVLQATKIRFTCLEIKEDHMKQLRELKFHPLKEGSSARIYHTAAWDMLVKNDWEELVEMMVTLSSIGEESTRPLDYSSLSAFLPESD